MAIRNEVLTSAPGHRCTSTLQLEGLPFAPGDVTAGSEDELQAVVVGGSDACDLPVTIRDSRFLKNIARRSSRKVAQDVSRTAAISQRQGAGVGEQLDSF